MPDEMPPQVSNSGVGWAFGVLAAVILIIVFGWGFGGQGHGWGQDNQMAHMTPPMASGEDGPAARAWAPASNGHGSFR
jgi:hypothetical protein